MCVCVRVRHACMHCVCVYAFGCACVCLQGGGALGKVMGVGEGRDWCANVVRCIGPVHCMLVSVEHEAILATEEAPLPELNCAALWITNSGNKPWIGNKFHHHPGAWLCQPMARASHPPYKACSHALLTRALLLAGVRRRPRRHATQ